MDFTLFVFPFHFEWSIWLINSVWTTRINPPLTLSRSLCCNFCFLRLRSVVLAADLCKDKRPSWSLHFFLHRFYIKYTKDKLNAKHHAYKSVGIWCMSLWANGIFSLQNCSTIQKPAQSTTFELKIVSVWRSSFHGPV